ncbi:MAG: carbohydrate kinase [Hyphomicrobiales bacterium]|nr:carbohydrate kinase [Hyphomicrobiales bacterium]
MTADRFLLGIDAGSSLCKAALFDREGRLMAVKSQRTTLRRPRPGWSELDPVEAWEATVAVLRGVVLEAGIDPGRVSGIGLSAAMVGAWVLDAAGEPLRPGIIWEDSRSQPILDRMQAKDPDVLSRIFRSSGSVLQQGCTLPVLGWLKENEPDLLAEACHVVSYKDYLRLRLTGLVATDRSEAAVIPGDARRRWRSDAMIALFGLEDLAHLLPAIRDSETIVGGLTGEAAGRTGLPEGLPVAIGAGDVAATVIGAGGLQPGLATAVLGTTCMAGICHDEPVFTPPDVGLLFSLPGDCWYRSMVNVAGTLNVDWAVSLLAPELVGQPDAYQTVTAMIEGVPPGANGVIYLPYLSESGIIAPVVAPDARAQFSGLTPAHSRGELLRAVFEGVAFALCDLVSTLGFGGDRMLLTGGGGKNPVWAQMIADVTNLEIVVPAGAQLGARGAALIAATALGLYPDIRTASLSAPQAASRYTPSAVGPVVYGPALALFQRRRDALIASLD